MTHIHTFEPCEFKDYEKCTGCGSYHSTALLPPDEVYVDKPYWGEDSGRSTWDQQKENFNCIDDCGISKSDRIMQFVPKRGDNALEIAAAPGELIKRLLDRNFNVWGIEPARNYVELLGQENKDATIIQGYFPEATKHCSNDVFDCIVASDLMEHIEDYEGFYKEVFRLLKPNGTAVIMSPIILEDGLLRKRDMEAPEQHAWIFTEKFLSEYLNPMFSEVRFSRWICGHEILILTK